MKRVFDLIDEAVCKNCFQRDSPCISQELLEVASLFAEYSIVDEGCENALTPISLTSYIFRISILQALSASS
ncbi:hypothetical protein N7468_007008 [Penicillium chermesinum]|uniref:Uncharacterized protein n=1 Tax=Penicillium chermesinum TaxID=63820 RepID=A0A9W9TK89_9EURO|nr:uncharacterized protein N7468_007008 [Penicillium chermesinum]KAJ5225783.1 hypothetical protein N7468_007008 [Penicillium chermesinum]